MEFKLGDVVRHKADTRTMVIESMVTEDVEKCGILWLKKKIVKREEKDVYVKCSFPIDPPHYKTSTFYQHELIKVGVNNK